MQDLRNGHLGLPIAECKLSKRGTPLLGVYRMPRSAYLRQRGVISAHITLQVRNDNLRELLRPSRGKIVKQGGGNHLKKAHLLNFQYYLSCSLVTEFAERPSL